MAELYEVINPSDAVTFRAASDAVAFYCVVVLGRGKAGCRRRDGQDLPTLMLFMPPDQVEQHLCANLGGLSPSDFLAQNREEIAAAFESFAYGRFSERDTYDAAIEAITDPEKLRAFKAKHEDRQRTSMNQWVQAAWNVAKAVRRG